MSPIVDIISDLHTEFLTPDELQELLDRYWPLNHPNGSSDGHDRESNKILVLAGDIGRVSSAGYRQVMERTSQVYRQVLVVFGNHEFYGVDYDEVMTNAATICKDLPNVIILNRHVYESDDYLAVGCIMWSEIEKNEAVPVLQSVNDFRAIPGHSLSHRNHLYKEELKWLEDTLQQQRFRTKPLICVTHFLPTYKMIHSDYCGSFINSAFANRLDRLLSFADLWVCGHSHKTVQRKIGSTLLCCNPLGYPEENDNVPLVSVDMADIRDMPNTM